MAYRATRNNPLTVEQFEALPEKEGWRIELVRGQLVREPGPGPMHGAVDALLTAHLVNWAAAGSRGVVLSNTGFILARNPDTVRIPNIAFVSAARRPAYPARGWWEIAPDLAVEIVSPTNTVTELQAKVQDYLVAGARTVWIVDPFTRTVTVYRSKSDIRLLDAGDELSDQEVLPGFRLALSKLFEIADR
jgi:Uma2 family endonuclease